MELIILALSVWVATWLMLAWRTYSVTLRLIEQDPRGFYIIKHRLIHGIIYMVCLFLIAPFIWQVAIIEESRRRWVVAYVEGILGIKK